MSLELRELRGDDLFLLISIFNKLDVIDELSELFKGNAVSAKDSKKGAQQIGIEVMAKLAKKALSNINLIQDDLNQLLALLAGRSVDEIRQIRMIDYVNAIYTIFNDSQFKDFFSSTLS